jgi:hypothetical protein
MQPTTSSTIQLGVEHFETKLQSQGAATATSKTNKKLISYTTTLPN